MATEPASPALARRHLDIGAHYLLRSVGLLWSIFDGDVPRGLVFLSVLRMTAQRPDESLGFVANPEASRPASLAAVARSLRMSLGTVRRHVVKLERAGFISRSRNGGVLVEQALLERPDVREALFANSFNLSQMSWALAGAHLAERQALG